MSESDEHTVIRVTDDITVEKGFAPNTIVIRDSYDRDMIVINRDSVDKLIRALDEIKVVQQ